MLNKPLKVVWLCYYSLQYLKDYLDVEVDSSFFHPSTWIHYLIIELQKRSNIELHIITLSSLVDKDYVIKQNNITHHIIKNSIKRIAERLPTTIFQKSYHFFESAILKTYIKRKVIKTIKNIEPQVVNQHGTEGEFGAILNDIKLPSIVWIQGMISQVVKVDNAIKYRGRLKNELSLFRYQKNFITVRGIMEEIISDYNKEANFINIFHPNPNEMFNLKQQHVEKDCDFVYVGQIVKRKGTEDFVESLKRVKEIKPDLKAKIIGYGGGEYQKLVENKIRDYELQNNIKLMGFLPSYSDVLMEIKKSRIFVLPTYVDSGPRSVAESMTIGVPVISYNVDGLPAMIQSEESGLLVETGNVNALSEAMIRLILDEKLREKFSEQAFKFSQDNFFAPTVVDKLVNTYHNLSANKNL